MANERIMSIMRWMVSNGEAKGAERNWEKESFNGAGSCTSVLLSLLLSFPLSHIMIGTLHCGPMRDCVEDDALAMWVYGVLHVNVIACQGA